PDILPEESDFAHTGAPHTQTVIDILAGLFIEEGIGRDGGDASDQRGVKAARVGEVRVVGAWEIRGGEQAVRRVGVVYAEGDLRGESLQRLKIVDLGEVRAKVKRMSAARPIHGIAELLDRRVAALNVRGDGRIADAGRRVEV